MYLFRQIRLSNAMPLLLCLHSMAVGSAFADDSICQRSLAIVAQLERLLYRKCASITAGDLLQITEIWGPETPPLPSDFKGLRSLRTVRSLRLNAAVDPLIFGESPDIEAIELELKPGDEPPAGVFSSLGSLSSLSISDASDLILSPASILAETPHLKHLLIQKVSQSRATNLVLTQKMFANLSVLESLIIGGSIDARSERGAFAKLIALKSLDTSFNFYSGSFPEALFADVPRLERFSFEVRSETEMTLPTSLLVGLGQVEYSVFKAYKGQNLPPGFFEPLASAINLEVSVGTGRIPENLFLGLEHLRALKLSAGVNVAVGGPSFWIGLPNLEHLTLEGFPASDLIEDSFRALSNLRSLVVHGGRGFSMSWIGNVVRLLPRLERFYFSYGEITDLDLKGMSSAEAPNLRSFEIFASKLKRIPAGLFMGLTGLLRVSFANNEIQEIAADAFEGLSNLHELNLSNNKLAELPPGLFRHNAYLTMIELRYNQLTSIPEGLFSGLGELTELKCDFNQVSSVGRRAFHGLTKLNRLVLTDNKLTTLDPGIFRVPAVSDNAQLYLRKGNMLDTATIQSLQDEFGNRFR